MYGSVEWLVCFDYEVQLCAVDVKLPTCVFLSQIILLQELEFPVSETVKTSLKAEVLADLGSVVPHNLVGAAESGVVPMEESGDLVSSRWGLVALASHGNLKLVRD